MQNDSCGRSRLAARALNSARKLLQLLGPLKLWCHAGAFGAELGEPGGRSRWWGCLPFQLRSQQPSSGHSSPPAASLGFTKVWKCALGRGVLVTLFLFPAWKRREASYLLSSGSRALPSISSSVTGLSCHVTGSALLKWMLKQQRSVSFFFPVMQIVCIGVNKETRICNCLPVAFKLCISLCWVVPLTPFVP